MRSIADPQPGHFRLRLIKGGPWVATEVRHCAEPERSPMWEVWLDGKLVAGGYQPLWGGPFDPSPDPVRAGAQQVWEFAEHIGPELARFMMADAEYCRTWRPEEPAANHRKKIDLGRMLPEFFMPRARK